jgi:hypothetical protein
MTTKLNKIAYGKMALQAEEARDLGLTKLAGNVFMAIGSVAREEKMAYNEEHLMNDVEAGLWKIAADIIAYHDLDGVDIQKVEAIVDELGERVVASIEKTLGVEGDIGGLEEKVFGQK